MPLQNRVSPSGEIFASTARGSFMGNRGGVIHNERREIVRQYAGRRWITCRLEFEGRRRTVMSPGRYTEMFFLDEAAALAAGHRPCAECRRRRFNAFKTAWNAGNPPLADEMNTELHAARIHGRAGKITQSKALSSLPDGCFVHLDGDSCLVLGDALVLWSPAGYVEKRPRPADLVVTVLTPVPIVQCIRRGYRPEIHMSVFTV